MKLLNKFLTFAFTAFLTLMLSNGVYAKIDFDKETKKQYGITIDNNFIPFKNNVGNEKDFVLLNQQIEEHIVLGEKLKAFIQSNAEVIPYANFNEPLDKFNKQSDNLTNKIFKDGIYNDEIFNSYIVTLKYDYQFYEFINNIYHIRLDNTNNHYPTEISSKIKSESENLIKVLKKKYEKHKQIYLDYFK